VKTKVEELKKNYSHIRKVRGDGNCFYRAMGYGYIERVIIQGEKAVKELVELIRGGNYLFNFGSESLDFTETLERNLLIIAAICKKSVIRALTKFAYLILFNSNFDTVLLYAIIGNYENDTMDGK